MGQREQYRTGVYRRPPLHRRGHVRRSLAVAKPAAARATASHYLILDHPRWRRRLGLEHLPFLHPDHRRVVQASAAAGAAARLDPDPLVRVGDLPAGRTRLAGLPTRLAARPTPTALKLRIFMWLWVDL